MEINCHTNLDLNFSETWPKELPCRPMIGDIITSSTGLELEVVRVVFEDGVPRRESSWQCDDGSSGQTMQKAVDAVICSVELHLPPNRFENITAFEKWYKGRK